MQVMGGSYTDARRVPIKTIHRYLEMAEVEAVVRSQQEEDEKKNANTG